jgi:hypothetical protein
MKLILMCSLLPRILAQVKPSVLAHLPIRAIDSSNQHDKSRCEQLERLVDQRIDLEKRMALVSTPAERTVIERSIVANDGQINVLVYELYDLTSDEMQIIDKVLGAA